MREPPAPSTLTRQEFGYAHALEVAERIEECQSWTPEHGYVTYCWMLWPSRNTWPTWHQNRPAPTPGCGCKPCARPRCCATWLEPITISTGATVAWICTTCGTSRPDHGWITIDGQTRPEPRPIRGLSETR